MRCFGCIAEVTEGYCPKCKKLLFGGRNVQTTLDFNEPDHKSLFLINGNRARISISGVQLKYSVRIEEDKLYLTDSGGQYLLKPIPKSPHIANAADAPANEHLTMQIAKQVFGIATAHNCMIPFRNGQRAYLTKRFDLKPDGTKNQQEDFAQLTNRTKLTHGESYKYDGSYEEIGALIKQYVSAPMPALEDFFELVVFNYVLSNGDAHLKNFSLIRLDNGEYRLSPAYDLLSTVLHTPLESDTALDLYENDMASGYYAVYGHYGRENFVELAKRLGLNANRAKRIIDNFAAKQEEIKDLIANSFLSDRAKQIYLEALIDKIRRFASEKA